MSTQIDRAWVAQFRANFDMLTQQMKSLLVEAVTVDPLAAEVGYRDQLGVVNPVRVTSRHQDTPFTEVPHQRRQFSAQDWAESEIIDKQDTQRMLTSPQSGYAQAFAAGFERTKDITILQAVFASARIGKTGESSVAFPAAQQIAVDYVETGSTTTANLTLGKLRRARTILRNASVSGPVYIAVTPNEIQSLLRTIDYTSSDYTGARRLEDEIGETGRGRFMGFTFIELEEQRFVDAGLLESSGAVRRIPVWSKMGLLYAPMRETEIEAMPDPTKLGNTRLIGNASFGATRLEENRVVEIKCSTTTF